jgi:hypothetical protein
MVVCLEINWFGTSFHVALLCHGLLGCNEAKIKKGALTHVWEGVWLTGGTGSSECLANITKQHAKSTLWRHFDPLIRKYSLGDGLNAPNHDSASEMTPKTWDNMIINVRLIFGVFLKAHIVVLLPCGVWRILMVLTKLINVQRCSWWLYLLPIFEQFE